MFLSACVARMQSYLMGGLGLESHLKATLQTGGRVVKFYHVASSDIRTQCGWLIKEVSFSVYELGSKEFLVRLEASLNSAPEVANFWHPGVIFIFIALNWNGLCDGDA